MTMARIGHLPVLCRGELVGIVGIGDLVKHRLDRKVLEGVALLDLSRMRSCLFGRWNESGRARDAHPRRESVSLAAPRSCFKICHSVLRGGRLVDVPLSCCLVYGSEAQHVHPTLRVCVHHVFSFGTVGVGDGPPPTRFNKLG